MCLEKIFGFLFKSKDVIVVPVETKSEPKITPNEWEVISSIKPEDKNHVLLVTYTNELGMKDQESCMVVFECNNEYKLVSPELGGGKILQKANLVDFKIDYIDR